jgi:hypothetical protein
MKKILISALVLVGLCLMVMLNPSVAGRTIIWFESLIDKACATSETGYKFPALSDIERMTLDHYDINTETTVQPFDIPEPHWGQLIESLSPSEYDPRPATWVHVGSMTIQLKSGRINRIDLYQLYEKPGAFSVESDLRTPNYTRNYYRGGDEDMLNKVILQAYAVFKETHKTSGDEKK